MCCKIANTGHVNPGAIYIFNQYAGSSMKSGLSLMSCNGKDSGASAKQSYVPHQGIPKWLGAHFKQRYRTLFFEATF